MEKKSQKGQPSWKTKGFVGALATAILIFLGVEQPWVHRATTEIACDAVDCIQMSPEQEKQNETTSPPEEMPKSRMSKQDHTRDA